jgi:hypothetical protein
VTNLGRFLEAIASGVGEQCSSLETRLGECPESLALRDYFSQLLAVAGAVGPDDSVDWRELDDRVGIDLEPDPREGFEPLSADSIEVGDAIALDAEGVPDASEAPRVVSETRQGGITVFVEFADGRAGASFSFDETLWRRVKVAGLGASG